MVLRRFPGIWDHLGRFPAQKNFDHFWVIFGLFLALVRGHSPYKFLREAQNASSGPLSHARRPRSVWNRFLAPQNPPLGTTLSFDRRFIREIWPKRAYEGFPRTNSFGKDGCQVGYIGMGLKAWECMESIEQVEKPIFKKKESI